MFFDNAWNCSLLMSIVLTLTCPYIGLSMSFAHDAVNSFIVIYILTIFRLLHLVTKVIVINKLH